MGTRVPKVGIPVQRGERTQLDLIRHKGDQDQDTVNLVKAIQAQVLPENPVSPEIQQQILLRVTATAHPVARDIPVAHRLTERTQLRCSRDTVRLEASRALVVLRVPKAFPAETLARVGTPAIPELKVTVTLRVPVAAEVQHRPHPLTLPSFLPSNWSWD